MYKVNEESLDWALKHILAFYDSDFFPKLFEFEAISHNWNNVKKHIFEMNLEEYHPKTPEIKIAPKFNGTFRIVHQLEPMDALIYTALIHEISTQIEQHRTPEKDLIACSYRISPDRRGSFFKEKDNGWKEFINQSKKLSDRFSESLEEGFVLTTDIADFYNQINLHRVNSTISEACRSNAGKIIEDFIMRLNTKVSRGIPVGPAASIIVAESIMADIDKKILRHTRNYTRYVDDMNIFFKTKIEAEFFLHELTKYMYTRHRLVLSGEKTRILPVTIFKDYHLNSEEVEERNAMQEKLDDTSGFDPYAFEYPGTEIENLDSSGRQEIRAETYREIFEDILNKENQNQFGILRHLLKKAAKYRIRNLLGLVLDKFDNLIPVIRESIQYIEKVINTNSVILYKNKFKKILESPYLGLPFINIWVFTLFQKPLFEKIGLDIKYDKIVRCREKVLIAKMLGDTTLIKEYKEEIDNWGYWDKRAIIYSSIILSKDELKHWLKLVCSKGDIVDKSLSKYIINQQKNGL